MILGLHWLDVVVLGCFLAFTTWIGLRASRGIKTSEQFFIGQRKFSITYMIFHAFGAGTHTDQAAQVAGKAATNGLSGAWSQLFWIFLTPCYWVIAPIFRRMRMVTTGDYFAARYGLGVSAWYAVVGVAMQTVNFAVLLKGAAVMIQAVTRGTIGETPAICVMTVLLVTYSAAGGITTAIVTDLIQGVLIFPLSFLLIPFMLHAVGGFGGLHDKVDAAQFELLGKSSFTPLTVLVLSINGLVGIVAQPHTMTNCGAGASEWEGRVGFTYGTFFKRICTVGWAFVGVLGIVLYPDLARGSEKVAESVFGQAIADFMPVGLVGLMLSCILAASIAACDVFIVTGAGLATRNLYRAFLGKGKDERRELLFGRLVTTVIVLGAVALAASFRSIFGGFLWFLSITAYMGIAWWMGILWKRANRYGALASFVAMFGTDVACYSAELALTTRTVLFLGAGLVAGVGVSLLTPREDPAALARLHAILVTPVSEPVPEPEALPASRRSPLAIFQPYGQTVKGFALAWLFVAAILLGTRALFRIGMP